jgi:ElaB/YqjD/DUF883 family membrane-anchored ribosome-binding protein
MDLDRDRQGSAGETPGTGDRSTTPDPSITGSPATPRDPSMTGTDRSGSFGAATPGGSFDSTSAGAGAPPDDAFATPEDSGARAGSFDRKFTGEEQGARDQISEKLEAGRERLGGAVDAGRNRVAGQLERISDRLEERGRGMEQAGGVQQRAGHVAVRAGEALDSGAEYLRSHDPDEMRDDLERSIRERPLLSVGIAVGAGFLLARLLRD